MRQCSFTEHDIAPIVHERKLLRYDAIVAIRNRENLKQWRNKYSQRWVKWEAPDFVTVNYGVRGLI